MTSEGSIVGFPEYVRFGASVLVVVDEKTESKVHPGIIRAIYPTGELAIQIEEDTVIALGGEVFSVKEPKKAEREALRLTAITRKGQAEREAKKAEREAVKVAKQAERDKKAKETVKVATKKVVGAVKVGAKKTDLTADQAKAKIESLMRELAATTKKPMGAKRKAA